MRIELLAVLLAGALGVDIVYWPGLSTDHQTGYRVGNAWATDVHQPENAFLTFGPYQEGLPASPLKVTFTLSIDNNSNDDLNILDLQINDHSINTILVSQTVFRTDFGAPGRAQNFTLYFTPSSSADLEFRVYYYCCAQITHYETQVQGPLDEGALGAFWHGQSHFAPVSHSIFPTYPNGPYAMNVGFDFVPLDGVWYLFHREYFYQTQPSYCKADYARTVVLTSTDRGLTWGNKTVVAANIPNTPTECAVLDGGAYYDASVNTWHFIGQCMARDEVWNMCHFWRQSNSPLGVWNIDPHNPVVQSGQLWGPICSGQGKHCPEGMGSEGTPEIVHKDEGGYYYVTFHGWDPAAVKSGRGIAKTRDFVNWVTDGWGLPDDSMFSSLDCNKWNIQWATGGCVGGGEGTITRSGDYYYQLIEAPDITLGCLTQVGVQNWVLGMLRSPWFAPSGQWAEMYVSPTVVPIIKSGCYIQYHRLFQDANGLYLEYWADSWMQIFVLTPGAGPLPIVAGPPS